MTVDNIKELGDWAKGGAKAAWRVFVYVIVAYSIAVGLFFLVSLGFLHLIGIETGVPPEIKPYTVIYGYLVMLLLVPAELVRQWLAARRNELLHAVDPADGDAGVCGVPPSVWEDLTVKTVTRGEDGGLHELDRDTNDLHRIDMAVSGGTRGAYECEYYDESTNTAYTAYYGDVSGSEIRKEMTEGVEYLRHEASVEREWNERLRRNFTDILEQQVQARVNYILHVLEDESVPAESSLRDDIKRATGEAEVADIVEGERSHEEDIDQDNPFQSDSLSLQVQGGRDE